MSKMSVESLDIVLTCSLALKEHVRLIKSLIWQREYTVSWCLRFRLENDTRLFISSAAEPPCGRVWSCSLAQHHTEISAFAHAVLLFGLLQTNMCFTNSKWHGLWMQLHINVSCVLRYCMSFPYVRLIWLLCLESLKENWTNWFKWQSAKLHFWFVILPNFGFKRLSLWFYFL